jgi:hypothetical protein
MAGIGLFLAFIGLHNGGLVAPNAATLVELGDPRSPAALLTLGGILLVAILAVRRVPGSILGWRPASAGSCSSSSPGSAAPNDRAQSRSARRFLPTTATMINTNAISRSR